MGKKPNVILLLADDLGIGDLSCFNPESKLNTENIDKLASEGLRCSDAHATSALCTPSRYGLLTGRYNWRSALKQVVLMGYARHLIEDGRSTLGTMFKGAGYNTAVVGKWHLGMDWDINGDDSAFHPSQPKGFEIPTPEIDYSKPVKNGPNDFGFDYSFVTPGSLDIAPYTFLENGKVTQKPFDIIGMKDFRAASKRGVVTDFEDIRLANWPEGESSPDYIHQNVVPDSANRVLGLIDDYANEENPFFIYYPIHAPHLPCIPTSEFKGKSAIGPYGDMVLMIDDITGRIMNKLDELGIAEDTIFIFASDNGSEISYPELGHEPSYIYRGHKSDIWEGGHRIPYIVRWPGHVPSGIKSAQTVSLVDTFATFSEILGIDIQDDEAEDSFSLLPIWQGNDESIRDYTVQTSGGGKFAIRKGKWKLEMCPGSGGFVPVELPNLPPIQLYDMEADVRETTNVYDKYPEVVDELTALLTECVANGRSTPGEKQKNTGPQWWPQLNWMDKPDNNLRKEVQD